MFGLSLTRLAITLGLGAALVLGLLWAGNFYGPNGRWRVNREAADKALNAVLTDLAEREDTVGIGVDTDLAALNKEFSGVKETLARCIIDASQASALARRAADLNKARK